MNIYTPTGWKLFKNEGDYYVFGSWIGTGLYGDSWRRNSGIVKVEEDDNYYYFYGYTGSCYKCHKENNCMTFWASGVLEDMLNQNLEAKKLTLDEFKKEWQGEWDNV